jgi:hypothetical protein
VGRPEQVAGEQVAGEQVAGEQQQRRHPAEQGAGQRDQADPQPDPGDQGETDEGLDHGGGHDRRGAGDQPEGQGVDGTHDQRFGR